MMIKLFGVLFLAELVGNWQVVSAQGAEKLPIPEYYGVYAVTDGKLASVMDGKSPHRPQTQSIELYSLAGFSGKSYSAFQFSPDVRFIVYSPTASDLGQSINLYKLAYVNNFFHKNDSGQVVKVEQVNGTLMARLSKLEINLLSKPVPSQSQMIQLIPEENLTPGIYVLFSQTLERWWLAPFFVSSSGYFKPTDCVDINFPTAGFGGAMDISDYFLRHRPREFPDLIEEHYSICKSTPGEAREPSSTRDRRVSKPACDDYDSCLKNGVDEFNLGNFDQSLECFKKASALNPSEPHVWEWLSLALLATGHYSEVPAIWDKILQMKGDLSFRVCLESGLICDEGTITVNPKEITFVDRKGKQVFASPPSEVVALNTERKKVLLGNAFVRFKLRVARKEYNFNYVPYQHEGCQKGRYYACTEPGPDHQEAVGAYVIQLIPKLAAGRFSTAKKLTCNDAEDLGYSILASGRLYKVKEFTSDSEGRVRVYFDEKGVAVRDSSLVQKLSLASWTRENVVLDQEVRSWKQRVNGMLETSKDIRNYEVAQSLVARGAVEAIQAYFSGGASLSKGIPNLTWGVIHDQFTNPRVLLTLMAQTGLQECANKYGQLESKLPPSDSSAFNLTELEEVKTLYIEARGLRSTFLPLASALMPTSGAQLTDQFLKSALSEALSRLPGLDRNSSTPVTLQGLFDLQKSLVNSLQGVNALTKYREGFTLAVNLAKADERTIENEASKTMSLTLQMSYCRVNER
jgi:tetratricopeptide (TPR) repeat protein